MYTFMCEHLIICIFIIYENYEIMTSGNPVIYCL